MPLESLFETVPPEPILRSRSVPRTCLPWVCSTPLCASRPMFISAVPRPKFGSIVLP